MCYAKLHAWREASDWRQKGPQDAGMPTHISVPRVGNYAYLGRRPSQGEISKLRWIPLAMRGHRVGVLETIPFRRHSERLLIVSSTSSCSPTPSSWQQAPEYANLQCVPIARKQTGCERFRGALRRRISCAASSTLVFGRRALLAPSGRLAQRRRRRGRPQPAHPSASSAQPSQPRSARRSAAPENRGISEFSLAWLTEDTGCAARGYRQVKAAEARLRQAEQDTLPSPAVPPEYAKQQEEQSNEGGTALPTAEVATAGE